MAEIYEMHDGHLLVLTQPPALDADLTTWRSEWCDSLTHICEPVAISQSTWWSEVAQIAPPIYEPRADTPEPAAMLLVALGVFAMLWRRL